MKILLLLFFLISCSTKKEADTYINQVITQSESDVVNNFYYGYQQISFFQNLPINDLEPNISGKKPIFFSTNPQLPKGLSIDVNTGIISGTPTELSHPTIYTIYAENSVGRVNISLSISIVNPPPTNLVINPNENIFVRGDDVIPYNVSIKGDVDYYTINPSLPDGLIFDPLTGLISGNPSVVQSKKSYSVKAYNQAGESNSVNVSIKIIDKAPINLSYKDSYVNYKVGQNIIPMLPSNAGGVITFYSIEPSLPAGLFLDVQNGKIFGTPLAEHFPAVNHTIIGYNTGGQVSTSLIIEVTDIPIVSLSYQNNISLTLGVETATLLPTFTGGKPTKYQINKSLPSGLFFNETNGRISGTPTSLDVVGDDYIISASNSQNRVDVTINLKIIDKAPMDLSTVKSEYTFRVGESNSAFFKGNTGGNVIRYEINPSLPDGLFLNDSVGAVQGIPSLESAKQVYQITAINSGGHFSFPFTLEVKDQPEYNLDIRLTSKSSDSDNKYFDFNLKNQTTLSGIGTYIPFSELKIDSSYNQAIELDESSSCLQVIELEYNSVCGIRLSIQKNISISNYIAKIKIGNFYEFNIDLSVFFDLTPQNIMISSDRLLSKIIFQDVSAKPLLTTNFYPVDLEREYINSFTTISNNKIYSDITPIINLIEDYESPAVLNNDPDNDGIKGLKNHENFNFTFKIKTEFDKMAGLNYICDVNPPYLATCEFPSFEMNSSDLIDRSDLSLTVKAIEADDNEAVETNSIPVNNYKITKIWNTINQSEDLYLYKDFLYFDAPLDKTTTNTRKLMKLDLKNDILSLSSKFTSNGDDRIFVMGELDDNILLIKAKNHESVDNYMTLFVYDLNDKEIYPFSLNSTNFKLNFVNSSDNYTFYKIQGNLSYFFTKDAQNQYVLYEYDKINKTLKKLLTPLSGDILDNNGRPEFSSVFINNNNVVFISNIKNQSQEIKKLIHYRMSDNILRKVINSNGDNASDVISDLVNFNNFIFYLSVDLTNNCNLISYNLDSLESRIIKTSNGKNCSISKKNNNSFYFVMNDPNPTLFQFKISDGEISKKFSATNPNDVIKITDRTFNLNEEIFFNIYDSEKESYSLFFYNISEDVIKNISNDLNYYSAFNLNFNNSGEYNGITILPSYLGLNNVAYFDNDAFIMKENISVKKNTDYSLSFFTKFDTGFGSIKIFNSSDELLFSINESEVTNNFVNIKTVNFGDNDVIKVRIESNGKSFYIDNLNIKDPSIDYLELIKGIDTSVFLFNNQYFFNCGVNNTNLCIYDKRTEQNALVVRNLNFEINTSLNGLVFYDNRLFFSTKKTDTKESGLYMMTIE